MISFNDVSLWPEIKCTQINNMNVIRLIIAPASLLGIRVQRFIRDEQQTDSICHRYNTQPIGKLSIKTSRQTGRQKSPVIYCMTNSLEDTYPYKDTMHRGSFSG